MSKRFLALLILGWCAACGDDKDSTDTTDEMESDADDARMGPPGCYIIADYACDCDIMESECTNPSTMVWVDGEMMGCSSCAL